MFPWLTLLFLVSFEQHIPKINGDIPSPDEEISDHQRMLDRSWIILYTSYLINSAHVPAYLK